MHECIAVTLVWGSLKLAPITRISIEMSQDSKVEGRLDHKYKSALINYRNVPGKRPWALAAQAPTFEGGLLHRELA